MTNKNAILITGAGQRIGQYLAKQFLLHTDYPVFFTYRTPKAGVDELVTLGATAIQADFTLDGDVERVVASLKQQVGSLRALIHNASLWLDDEVEGSFEAQWRVHVQAPFTLNETLYPLLAETLGGSDIISLTDASLTHGHQNKVGYFASKAALQEMTYAYAKKYAPNIKVNTIAPGLLMFNENDNAEYRAKRLADLAIPLEPGADVIWQAVRYLMQSPYTTGSVLKLDGGYGLR